MTMDPGQRAKAVADGKRRARLAREHNAGAHHGITLDACPHCQPSPGYAPDADPVPPTGPEASPPPTGLYSLPIFGWAWEGDANR